MAAVVEMSVSSPTLLTNSAQSPPPPPPPPPPQMSSDPALSPIQHQYQQDFAYSLPLPPPSPNSKLVADRYNEEKEEEAEDEEDEDEERGGEEKFPMYLHRTMMRRADAINRIGAARELRMRKRKECWCRLMWSSIVVLTALSMMGIVQYVVNYQKISWITTTTATVEQMATPMAQRMVPNGIESERMFGPHELLSRHASETSFLPNLNAHEKLFQTFIDVHVVCKKRIFGIFCPYFDKIVAAAIAEFNVKYACKYNLHYGFLPVLDMYHVDVAPEYYPPGISEYHPPFTYLDFYKNTPEDYVRVQVDQLRIVGVRGSKMTTDDGSLLNRPRVIDTPLDMLTYRYGFAFDILENQNAAAFYLREGTDVVGCVERNVTYYGLHTSLRRGAQYFNRMKSVLVTSILVRHAERVVNTRRSNLSSRDHEEEEREKKCAIDMLTQQAEILRLHKWRLNGTSPIRLPVTAATTTTTTCFTERMVLLRNVDWRQHSMFDLYNSYDYEFRYSVQHREWNESKATFEADRQKDASANETVVWQNMQVLEDHLRRVLGILELHFDNYVRPSQQNAFAFSSYINDDKTNVSEYLYEILKRKYENRSIITMQEYRSWLPFDSINPTVHWLNMHGTPRLRMSSILSSIDYWSLYVSKGITSSYDRLTLHSTPNALLIPIPGSYLRHLLAIRRIGHCAFVVDEKILNTAEWVDDSFRRGVVEDVDMRTFQLVDGTIVSIEEPPFKSVKSDWGEGDITYTAYRYKVEVKTHLANNTSTTIRNTFEDLERLVQFMCKFRDDQTDIIDMDPRVPLVETTDNRWL